ncbi:MAG: MFS transporter [Eggerthellaceae bacterium]|nr:MFS transporter [Eggerthellaceae bacterium]
MKKFTFRDFMVFIILSAAVAIAYQLPYLRFTFYDQMMDALALNNTQIGLLATAVNLVSTISYPIGGILADKFSMRKLIIVTLGAFVILTVWYAFTTDFVMLMIIHALYGFFGIATLWSTYLMSVRNLGNEENQSTMFGSSEATRSVIQTLCGVAFLAVVGAAMSAAEGFRNLLLVGAGVSAVFLVLAIIFLPDHVEPHSKQAAQSENAGPEEKYTFVDVFKNPGVWLVTGVIMCCFIVQATGNGYLTTYTVQILQIDQSLASTLGILRSYVIAFLAGYLGGWLLDRFTYKGKVYLVGLAVAIAMLLGVIFTTPIIPLCVAMTLLLAFLANIMKATYWSTMDQAGIPNGMTALATGLISFIAFIPDFIVPTISGIWIDEATLAGTPEIGFYKIFIMLAVFAAVGIVFSFLLYRRTKKLEAAGEIVVRSRK